MFLFWTKYIHFAHLQPVVHFPQSEARTEKLGAVIDHLLEGTGASPGGGMPLEAQLVLGTRSY